MQWHSFTGDFAPQRTFSIFWSYFALPDGKVLLASSGKRGGVLLNLLPCPGQPHTAQKYPTENASNVKVNRYCPR